MSSSEPFEELGHGAPDGPATTSERDGIAAKVADYFRSGTQLQDRGKSRPPIPFTLMMVFLLAVVAGIWVWAIAARGSTEVELDQEAGALLTAEHHLAEADEAHRNAELDLTSPYNLPNESQIPALERSLAQKKQNLDEARMHLDDTRAGVQRLESLMLRWWWKASFITLAAGAYLLMLPAVIRFAAADVVAKEESDKLFPETPSPTLESIWSESRNRLRQYHEIALSHSTRAFNAAMIAMGLGGVVLAAAVFYLLAIPGGRDWSTTVPVAGIAGLSSAYATAIARTFFATMNKTSDQLSDFFTQPTDESHAMLVQALVADEPTETRLALKSEFIRSLSTRSGAATEPEGESKR